MRAFSRFAVTTAFVFLLLHGLFAEPASAKLKIRVEAFAGQRFGVGWLKVELPADELPELLGVEGLGLSERSGRAYYPAVDGANLGEVIGGLFGAPQDVMVYFLFQGEDPLELTLHGRSNHAVEVAPVDDAEAYQKLLTRWWKQYAPAPKLVDLQRKHDYPPVVETYLRTQLARRLNLELPKRHQTESWQDQLAEEAGLLLGTEAIRVAMQQDRLLGLNNLHLRADQPLPEPVRPTPLQIPEPADGGDYADVPVEPIALRVPAECLYIRFGKFSNLMWTQDTLGRLQGEVVNLFAMRGMQYDITRRTEQQLVLKETALARLLGDQVITDVAIVGTDLFVREGGAFGLLFHARNNIALGAELARQRIERLAAGGVSEEKLDIAGHTVSLLASADGSVRSYYASDGDYHFVTTSRRLVERFFETADGTGALGTSQEFRYARSIMPLKRDDTVFVYVSDAFLGNLVSPHYRIEMQRRLQAAADIDLVQLAKLTAASEGKSADSIDRLGIVGLLPLDFSPRPDGSSTVLSEQGAVHDSLRGRRGTFLPVPDTPVTSVTAAEASAYRAFAEQYEQKWRRIDPVLLAVKRSDLPEGRERVDVEMQMGPMTGALYELLANWAGPADGLRVAPVPGDLASGQLVLKDQLVFGGIRDFEPPLPILGKTLSAVGVTDNLLPSYVGTTGEAGVLEFIDNQVLALPNALRLEGSPAGWWRRKTDQFTVYSLYPRVLRTVPEEIRLEQSERPAQLRLWVADPSQAEVRDFLNHLGYERSRSTTLGNLQLLHVLDQQLHIPPEDCKAAAEFLLDARLSCALGGQYVFGRNAAGIGRWSSCALSNGGGGLLPLLDTRAPAGYEAPLLKWFRGLDFDARLNGRTLEAQGSLVLEPPAER